jgi:hypothetical protein
MAKAIRNQVRQRAGDVCEYCRMPQEFDVRPFQLDHIRAEKHHGPTELPNLCWSCLACNSFKGSDQSAYDPETDKLVPLFNPRVDVWSEHFEWNGPELTGRTTRGRATIDLLRINQPEQVAHRWKLTSLGVFPPTS